VNKLSLRVVASAAIGAVIAAVTLLSAADAVAQTKGRMSFHWAPDHESAIMSFKLANEVNKRSGGKLQLDVFPSGQLYTIRQITSALSAGSVEIGGVVTFNQFPSLDKDWNIFAFPNLWESVEQQRRFLTDTKEGKALRERVLKKANLVHIAYVPTGPYVTFSTKSDLSTIESMKGLKARSLAPNERPGYAARGMNVVSLSTEEVYQALQNGMIDTLSTVPTAVKAYAWWDHLKFGQLPYAIYSDAELMANATWFNGLPKDMQDLVTEVGREISKEASENSLTGNAAVLKEMEEKHGGKITVLTGETLERFRKLDREKTMPELAKLVSPEILAAARSYVEKK
jgi:TRAP-type C4-dicarboxylate transport system substrate-binding protein